ncbi:hypothetical protein HNQ93_003442 [Hymenobacter luteus]|uniref:Calcineurin-like phosphoesterase domain-containing protein n=2 Tax=Hymenobacter TaxID=89966 RepID=A0A7W9T3V6_9BACT|nr:MULTISPECIES: metallophosphoesterase [Hymenobacter]MBB4602677.1 hypothetical protein [Hymenobacter latericoloratus]MBB6060568.1 hypothetical protein [Hymenobacter luteus]
MVARAYKRIAFGVLLLYVLYLAGGIALAATGVLSKVYFFPGWALKAPSHDASAFAPDGPIVRYQSGAALSTAIVPRGAGLLIQTDTLTDPARSTVRCYVNETGTSFTVPLHPRHTVEPSEYPAPAKMLVVSDIEGNFKGLDLLLRTTGVVDSAYRWRFGNGHLVVVGDVFDRGLQVTECLWLLYKLEQEAARAGGKVHFILGNHELMNLTGHYKYVRRKYRRNADSLRLDYAAWYGPETELGRWLRTKNVVEKIGSTLFVHGGISPEVLGLRPTLAALNEQARNRLDAPPARNPAGLAKVLASPQLSPDWYRGLAQQEASAGHVQQVLTQYGVRRMVIGHTPVTEITPLYGGKVVAIDLPHQENTDEQQLMKALWIENGRFYAIRTDTSRREEL